MIKICGSLKIKKERTHLVLMTLSPINKMKCEEFELIFTRIMFQ